MYSIVCVWPCRRFGFNPLKSTSWQLNHVNATQWAFKSSIYSYIVIVLFHLISLCCATLLVSSFQQCCVLFFYTPPVLSKIYPVLQFITSTFALMYEACAGALRVTSFTFKRKCLRWLISCHIGASMVRLRNEPPTHHHHHFRNTSEMKHTISSAGHSY